MVFFQWISELVRLLIVPMISHTQWNSGSVLMVTALAKWFSVWLRHTVDVVGFGWTDWWQSDCCISELYGVSVVRTLGSCVFSAALPNVSRNSVSAVSISTFIPSNGKSTESIFSAGFGHAADTGFHTLTGTVGCKYGILFNGKCDVGCDDDGKFSLNLFPVCITLGDVVWA